MYNTRLDGHSPHPGFGPMVNGAPQGIPLAAPRPGYPAPVSNLKIPSPSPSTPEGRVPEQLQMGQVPQALRVTHPQAAMGAPMMPPPIYQTSSQRPSVPSTPHPLQPPMTPITPVFARPSKSPAPPDVKFSSEVVILRGNSEDNLIPKRGDKGDDFWRRFSMVAKEEKKPSIWLTKTQSGTTRLSRWVWIVGMILLICTVAGAVIGWYVSHNAPSHQPPKAVGGSAGETAGPAASSTVAAGQSGQTSSPHVTPTFTLAHRDAAPDPTPAVFEGIHIPTEDVANVSKHRKHRLRNF